MADMSSRRIVGLLADEGRRRVVASLVLHGDSSTTAIAAATGLTLREVVEALDRLGSLVAPVDGDWHLDAMAFQRATRAEADAPAESAFSDEPEDVARALDTAFGDGRLVQWPTKRSKRLVVLDHLAQRFEIGERYPEAAVNAVLREVHDDVAMLRRWLVDEQFLDRSGGEYWRCGGSV